MSLIAWSYKHVKTGWLYPDVYRSRQGAQDAIKDCCTPDDFKVVKVEIREAPPGSRVNVPTGNETRSKAHQKMKGQNRENG